MITKEDYSALDATGLVEGFKAKDFTRKEALETAQSLAHEMDPDLNMFVEIFEEPLEGASRGPFSGVPFVIKDIVCHAKGVGSEAGSRLLKGVVADADTELMSRWKAAGLRTIGRTATPEMGFSATTESLANGPTRNPWDTRNMPGGSSGGTAAAIASGVVPMGHANDGAGSIRIPAACCGLVGLKPSRGRVTLGPDHGSVLNDFGIEFALTRSVRDCAALLDAVAYPNPGDPYQIAPFAKKSADVIRTPPKNLKIAFATNPWGPTKVSPDMVEATKSAAKLCEDLGHVVERARPPMDFEAFMATILTVQSSFLYHGLAALEAAGLGKISPKTVEHTTYQGFLMGSKKTADDMLSALDTANLITRSFAQFFEEYDVLLTPTTSKPSLRLGVMDGNVEGKSAEDWFAEIVEFSPFLAPFNMTGQPGISVPLHRSRSGLPCGVQFVGKFGSEQLLLRLARQIERAAPWPKTAPINAGTS